MDSKESVSGNGGLRLEDFVRELERRDERVLGHLERLMGDFAARQVAQFNGGLQKVKREILKAIGDRMLDGLEIQGPRTAERCQQVLAVVAFLANPKHNQSIHHACTQTFQPTAGGYPDSHALFNWCNDHASRIWSWVENWRLDHG